MVYFREVQPFILGNPNLWESQRDAYAAIKEYFDQGKQVPALAVLPTGTGKTGLLAIIPYGIAERRVLIIAPGLVIKRGIMASLDSSRLDNFWLQRKVIMVRDKLPTVVEYESDTRQQFLQQAHFVVTNIQLTQLANENSLLNRVPPDFFDMIIMDEAHHSPAETWRDVEEYFSAAKKVKLTGTPFRSDNEPIYAQPVFNYPLGRAMANKYVKRLINQTWLPEDLTFRFTDDEGRVNIIGYKEAVALKDQEWVSRHVAYSLECSRTVVTESLRIMQEKRRITGRPHKIIAVAQNIDHAEEIKMLYEEAGARTTIVSSRLDDVLNEARLNDFANDRAQVIVNVGMLGEGFDHPLISVAAIFRPFRSLLPYAQFAGRALRAVAEGSDVDNTAHLVYHRALGLDGLWEYYRKEQERADIIEKLREADTYGREDDEALDEIRPRERVDIAQIGSIGSYAASFLEDIDVVAEYNSAIRAANQQAQQAIEVLRANGLPVTDEIIQALLSAQEERFLEQKRPDLDYKERRKRLNRIVQDGVIDILDRSGIDPRGDPRDYLRPMFPKYAWILEKTTRVDGFLVTLINDHLRQYIGHNRDQWTTADYARAQPEAEMYLRNLAALLAKEGEQA